MNTRKSILIKRVIREEAGMTLGLAIIMIVLIGVMGAGLLVFVQRDLETVIEVNRGQKASEASDSGIQAAKKQLLTNSFPHQYNDPATATFPEDASQSNSGWAFNSAAATCGDLPSGPGKCIMTTEGNIRVTIKYLPPPPTAAQRTDPKYAPETLPSYPGDYKDGHDYFLVESDGIFNGARRKIQAILVTRDLGLPKAYFSTRNINLASASTTISDVSLFSKGNVTGVRDGMLLGRDKAYDNWQLAPYNDKSRLGSAPANDPTARESQPKAALLMTRTRTTTIRKIHQPRTRIATRGWTSMAPPTCPDPRPR